MNDNTEYWKELFGDDYNDDLMRMLNDPNQQGKTGDEPYENEVPYGNGASPNSSMPISNGEPGDIRPDGGNDGARFHSYEFPTTGSRSAGKSSPVSPPEGKTGMDRAASGHEIEPNDKSEDFNVDFDFDGEYRDLPDDRPVRPRRQKRTGCLGGIIYAVFIICVCLLLASLAWLAATDVLGFGNEDEMVQVTIPRTSLSARLPIYCTKTV
jgi:hypothetical protein